MPLVAWLMYRTVVRAARARGGRASGGRDVGRRCRPRVRYSRSRSRGALAALGGVYLALDQHQFTDEMTAGRGFIALAAVIFGRWDPLRAGIACLLFAAAEALQIQLQGSQRHAVAVRRDDPVRADDRRAGRHRRPRDATGCPRQTRGMNQHLQSAADFVGSRIPEKPTVMLVLGSGLGALADEMTDAVRIPFQDVPGFAASTVEGHPGNLVVGKLAGVVCATLQGRFHMYEGHDAATVALPIRAMAALGARTLILSNAAGGVNPEFRAGDLMIIEDHINLDVPESSYRPGGQRRHSLSRHVRTVRSGAAAARPTVAHEQGIALRRGVYLGALGPSV